MNDYSSLNDPRSRFPDGCATFNGPRSRFPDGCATFNGPRSGFPDGCATFNDPRSRFSPPAEAASLYGSTSCSYSRWINYCITHSPVPMATCFAEARVFFGRSPKSAYLFRISPHPMMRFRREGSASHGVRPFVLEFVIIRMPLCGYN